MCLQSRDLTFCLKFFLLVVQIVLCSESDVFYQLNSLGWKTQFNNENNEQKQKNLVNEIRVRMKESTEWLEINWHQASNFGEMVLLSTCIEL